MKNILFFLTIMFFLITFSKGAATEPLFDDLAQVPLDFKNPFIPAMPKKEAPVKQEGQLRSAQDKEPKTDKPVSPPKLEIKGIVWNTDKPQAIINNKVVTVGDQFDNVKIIAISKLGIEIDFLETRFLIDSNSKTTLLKNK